MISYDIIRYQYDIISSREKKRKVKEKEKEKEKAQERPLTLIQIFHELIVITRVKGYNYG